ncbi:hypothetical protein MKW98_011218, partial [Papaver atlanticum]
MDPFHSISGLLSLDSNYFHLEIFSVSYNNLTGQLPASIANLSTKLIMLYMGGNNIYGEIPPGIENLVSLNGLDMESNQLQGEIPPNFGNCSKLQTLYLSQNQLT